MSLATLVRRSLRSLWQLSFLALLATLIHPGSREVHLSALRAFFHLSGGKTEVSPGGFTRFTTEYVESRKAIARSSPDAYLLLTERQSELSTFPPPAAWASDPLLPWAAVQSAAYLGSAERIAADPARSGDAHVDGWISTTQGLSRLALELEPDNGAIWLAEALARFVQGDDEAALFALEVAVRRGWNDHGREVPVRRQNLLMAEGFAAFDAALVLQEDICPVYSVQWHIQRHLSRLLVCAVQEGDDPEFVHLLTLARELLQAGPRSRDTSIGTLIRFEKELLEAMAEHLGYSPPERALDNRAASGHRSQAEKEVWCSYLRTHAAELGELIIAEDFLVEAQREQRRRPNLSPAMAALLPLLYIETLHKAALLLIGILVAALIARFLAWLWPPEWDGRKMHVRGGFLLAAIPAYALMFYCIRPILEHMWDSELICVLVSRDPADRPLLTGAQQDMIVAGLAALLPLLAIHVGPWWRTLYSVSLLAILYLYLAAVATAAVLRQEVLILFQTSSF